jgi:hypothetical protein
MAQNPGSDENTPRHHPATIKEKLTGVIEQARSDVDKLDDPKAQALFETTAEVLSGFNKAYEDYEQGTEAAWKKAS